MEGTIEKERDKGVKLTVVGVKTKSRAVDILQMDFFFTVTISMKIQTFK